jgi:hypothetical protein
MSSCIFAAFDQHFQKLARSFSLFIEAYDSLYGIASTLEPALRHPSIYLSKHLARQPQLYLSQNTTVNNTVYKTLKPSARTPAYKKMLEELELSSRKERRKEQAAKKRAEQALKKDPISGPFLKDMKNMAELQRLLSYIVS